MIGPLPPPKGGATVSFQHFARHLEARADVRITVVETWNPTHSFPHRTATALKAFWQALRLARDSDVITFWASDRGMMYFGPLIKVVSQLTSTPWIIRKFGGGLDITYANAGQWQKYLIEKVLLSTDLNLLQTHHLVRYFQSKCPGANIDWHPNGRPIDDASQSNASRCDKFIFLGKVKKTKGLSEIIDATSRFPKGGVKVDIFGPLEKPLSKSDFAEATNLTYKGVVEPSKLQALLPKYHALLLPTYYRGEGYPGAILEAYSVGIPVISTQWRAIPEIVDESSGILVEPQDSDALYKAMKRLKTDSQYYQQLRRGAWEKRKDFSLARWADKFVDYCKEVVANHTHG